MVQMDPENKFSVGLEA